MHHFALFAHNVSYMFSQDLHHGVLAIADVDLGLPRANRPTPVELLAREEGKSVLIFVLLKRWVV